MALTIAERRESEKPSTYTANNTGDKTPPCLKSY